VLASLRARLALSFALVVAMSLVVAAASLFALLRGYSARLVQARLDDVVVVVGIQARALNQRGEGPVQVLDFLAEQADRLDVRILLTDRVGRIMRETGRGESLIGARIPLGQELLGALANRQPLHGSVSSPRNRQTYQYSAVPLPNQPGALVVAQAEGTALATLSPLAQRLGMAGGAGLIGGLLAAVLLTRWFGRPLARLLAATQALASGDYTRRVEPGGPSELVQLSTSFNTMADEVERSRQIVHRFVSTLSHELRTPLTAIRGFATAVLDGSVSDPDELRRAMQIVDREARRMQRLAAELLDLSRLQTGQVPMRREPVNLTELVRHCVEVLEARAQERQIGFKLELPELLPLEGDADRLEQVFTNLLDNAVKFTPSGESVLVRSSVVGPAPASPPAQPREGHTFGRSRTAPPAPRTWVVIDITNPGPHIPADELSHIFEQFYTGSEGQARGGTGLGLPVAREIARAHGGEVTAESAAGLTTFRLSLPCGPDRNVAVTPPPLTVAASR
jgi:two-component system, OmpR family, sensor kinase